MKKQYSVEKSLIVKLKKQLLCMLNINLLKNVYYPQVNFSLTIPFVKIIRKQLELRYYF